MARQLNLSTTGQIIPTALHQEMQRSYLEYAMSVIVGRALPDVRDGLKPVHRRILYAMYELGLTPDRPFRKCARVVGDVLGKYHPHGDMAVYDALVRMVQDFSSRYPLLAGHGNFGSVDNDPPAAMRYTETRLAGVGHEAILEGISEAIVDFSDNFDSSQQEPVVLPAQLPFLVLNGCSGIAVGMATNIPPHNLGEVVDGLIALIDKPDLADEKLLEIIPGPDFPTGGQILDTEGIKEAYLTGKGIIPVRGVTKIEHLDLGGKRRRRHRTAIVVTELPYQVNKSGWIEKVADLVNQGKIEGIADIRDESDRTGIRVVIELKRETKPKTVLQDLYKKTALQSNFGAIMLTLVNNQPFQLPLRRLLEEFLKFREETLTRQYTYDLDASRQRSHLLQGLLIALNHLDTVIEILRQAADSTTAKVQLQEQLAITPTQGDAILAMPMRRLTGLERQKLQAEFDELQQKIQQLETLLNDRHELLKVLKKELRSLKRKFADERRTQIIQPKPSKTPSKPDQPQKAQKEEAEPVKAESKPLVAPVETPTLSLFTPQPPPENAILTVTHQGFIYWISPDHPPAGHQQKAGDFPIYQRIIGKREQFIAITDHGKAYPIATQDIPPQDSQPTLLLNLLPSSGQRDAKQIVSQFFLTNANQEMVLLTDTGKIKRLPMSEFTSLTNRGLVVAKLKEDDRLGYVCQGKVGDNILIATSGGRILRLPLDEPQLPIMGRNTQGNQVTRLRYGETIAGCVALQTGENLLLVSELGYGKQIPIDALRMSNLRDLGAQAIQFTHKTDNLVGIVLGKAKSTVILLTSQQRKLPINGDTVAMMGTDGTGDRLVQLNPNETIIAVRPLDPPC